MTRVAANSFIRSKAFPRILDHLDRLAAERLHLIVNETVDIHDGGVSGVAHGGIIEFAPDDTPRAVEKPDIASLPRAMGLAMLQTVYGFAPELPEDLERTCRVQHPPCPTRLAPLSHVALGNRTRCGATCPRRRRAGPIGSAASPRRQMLWPAGRGTTWRGGTTNPCDSSTDRALLLWLPYGLARNVDSPDMSDRRAARQVHHCQGMGRSYRYWPRKILRPKLPRYWRRPRFRLRGRARLSSERTDS